MDRFLCRRITPFAELAGDSMDCLEAFLEGLLYEGRIVFRRKPTPPETPGRALRVLERAFEAHRLEVAGSLIPFDSGVAYAASLLVLNASWALVDRSERLEALEARLVMPHPPSTPAHHLSADLVFRYLPQLHRRARGFNPADGFAGLLSDVLARWPLSGVLGGLEPGPGSPADFGGHEGLMLLYAERWARDRPEAWRPSGRPLEYVDWIVGRADGVRTPATARERVGHG